MSAPAPTTRRTGSGSRRFNPLLALQPKRHLQQILTSSGPGAAGAGPGAAGAGPGAAEAGPGAAGAGPGAAGAGPGAEGAGPGAAGAAVGSEAERASVTTASLTVPVPAPPAFDYCRFIELDYVPMESSGYMASMRPTKGQTHGHKSPSKGAKDRHSSSPSSGPARSSSPSVVTQSRRTAPPSSRDTHGQPALCSSSSGSCKGSDCSPTKGRQKLKSCTENHGIRPPPPEQYLTPLQQKEVCIRHLRAKLQETISALQTRDCEIDELKERLFQMQEDWVEEECHRVEAQLALKEARHEIQALRQAVDGVREAGDSNIQNHRLEHMLLNMEMAQAGLSDLGETGEKAGFQARAGGSAPASVSGESPRGALPRTVPGARVGSCSCDGSPARSLARSATYTKLTEQALAQKNTHEFGSMSAEGTQDSGFCGGESAVPSRADLLLEAAYLSEETASLLNTYTQTFASLPPSLPPSHPHSLPHTSSQTLPHSFPRSHPARAPLHALMHSSTCEGLCTGEHLCSGDRLCSVDRLCSGDHLAPYRCGLSTLSCVSHPCLSHHLFLHSLREAGIQTESCPIPATVGSDLDTIAEARTFRSQACSPTSTWMSDDGEELDSTASLTTATVKTTATEPIPTATGPGQVLPSSATVACSMESPVGAEGGPVSEEEEKEKQETETREKERPPESAPLEAQRSIKDDKGKAGLSKNSLENQPYERIPLMVCSDLQHDDMDLTTCTTELEDLSCPALSPDEQPQTSQPKRSSSSHSELVHAANTNSANTQEIDGDEAKDEAGAEEDVAEGLGDSAEQPVERSYWSRHFLVDLLAVAIPVVPTVAWLCRGPVRDAQPMYHFGSLLRGCCTVALHSLRRGGGLRHYPAGGGMGGGGAV